MTPQAVHALLSDFFAPHSAAQFFEQIAGKVTHYHASAVSAFREGLLGPNPAATILDAYSGLAGHVSIVGTDIDKQTAPEAMFADRGTFERAVAEIHAKRHTVMISNAPGLGETAARLKRALEQVTGVFVQSTIFWAPPEGGTKVHRDEIDTLAIQIRGSKSWLISAEELGYPNHWNQISPGAGGLKACTFPCAREQPHVEMVMREGDLLYVPKGQWHEVSAFDEESISLVFGSRPATTRDILNVMIDYLSDRERDLRTTTGMDMALELSNGGPSARAEGFTRAFLRAADYYRNGGHFEDAMQWKRASFIGGMPALEAKGAAATLLSDRVRLADLAICSVSANGPSTVLSYPGDHLTAPAAFEPTFRFIAETEEFQVRDLPGQIGDGSRLKVVNKLIEQGVLELCS